MNIIIFKHKMRKISFVLLSNNSNVIPYNNLRTCNEKKIKNSLQAHNYKVCLISFITGKLTLQFDKILLF